MACNCISITAGTGQIQGAGNVDVTSVPYTYNFTGDNQVNFKNDTGSDQPNFVIKCAGTEVADTDTTWAAGTYANATFSGCNQQSTAAVVN